MTDILKRLRDGAESAPSDWVEALFTDAADEIERLRAALEGILLTIDNPESRSDTWT